MAFAIFFAVIEVASGDYGDQWASILAKAIALSSDSDSSGLANDCSGSENASEHSSLAGTTGKKVPALKAGDKQDKDLVVTLMPPMESDDSSTPMGSLGSINGDCRCGRFWNQFSTLFKRSFVCIMRDTVSKQYHRDLFRDLVPSFHASSLLQHDNRLLTETWACMIINIFCMHSRCSPVFGLLLWYWWGC